MSDWTYPLLIALPNHLIDLANKLAFIIDPDTGGDKTFTLDRQINGCVCSWIPFIDSFLPVVMARNPDAWFEAMTQLAESRGREALTREEIETLCREMKIGDEVNLSEVPSE